LPNNADSLSDPLTNRPEELQAEAIEEAAEEHTGSSTETTDELTVKSESVSSPELTLPEGAKKPSPEEIPDSTDDEDVHLGAESAPSVDTKLHKTHPAIH